MQLSPLTVKAKDCISNVDDKAWVKLEVTADTGACTTVMPTSMCSRIKVEPSEGSKASLEYEVAHGHAISNTGQRDLEIMTEG